jgi:autotransporter-associated beta strand protein
MLAWASATFNPAAFVLNAAAANNNLTLLNAIDLYGGTRTVSVNAATATISGVITDTVGNAALTMTGAGTLIASNSVNYTGLTTVNSGTLVFSAGYNNGTPNGLTKSGSGTLLLTAPVTYTGTTTVKQGTVQLGANGVLPNTAALVLGDTTALANAGTLDLNGNSFTVPSLSVVTLASNNSTATNAIINLLPGQTLNIVNASAGSVVDIAEGTHLVISGGGAFDVNAPSGDFHIRGYRSGNGTNFSGLNVSQLASFAAVVNNFYVCDDIGLANASRQGILSLAATNTITANSFYAGYSTQAGTAPGIVLLGVSNTFNVANLYLGYGKANGTLTFNSTVTGGQLTLTGTNGTRANLYLGYFAPGGLSGTTPTGTLTITNTGASVSAMLDQLIIGYEAQNNGSTTASGGFGSLTFNAGTIDANTLVLGQNIATVTRGAAAGTLTINGGVLNVHSNFTLANRPGNTGTATVNGTLLISGGLVNAFTNITDGGGTSTLTLNGGTLDMQTHNIGDGVNPINNLTLQSGALMNVAEINGGSNITVAAAANTLTLLSTNSWSGNTILNAGTLTISGLLPNSRVIANSGVLAGNGNVGQTVIVSNNATLSPGNYTGHIATFTAGNLTITNNAVLALDLGAPTTAGVTYDTVTVTNQLNFAAINTNYFVFTALGGFGVAGEYTLLQFANAGSVSMDPTGGTNYINILGSGRDAALWYDTVGNNIKLTVIPEPDALLLVAGGIGLLVLMRRRARR